MLRWEPAQKGYVKIKVQCPECGHVVAGKVDIKEDRAEMPCQCGHAVLQVILTIGFEWEIEKPISTGEIRNGTPAIHTP